MRGRHVIFLAEDEPEMAAQLIELFRSMGWDVIHAATKEDAERIVEDKPFCAAVIDLQLKLNADSISAYTEAGLTLVVLVRSLFPRRNERDVHPLPMHLVPIFGMSGQAKDSQYVVRAFKAGADGFISKPVSQSNPSLVDAVEEALRRSGREHHDRCDSITEEARQPLTPAAPGVAVAGSRLRVAITGQMLGKKTLIEIEGQAVPLGTASFVIVLQLVLGRLRDREGWVHKVDLGARGDTGWKGASRLKAELEPRMPAQAHFLDNDSSGRYRLHSAITIERIDHAALAVHTDARVRSIGAEIRRAQEARASSKPAAVRR